MLMRFFILIVCLDFFPVTVYAERVLAHLSSNQPTSTELAQINAKGQIIRDLYPLPWLVIEIPDNRRLSLSKSVENYLSLPEPVEGNPLSLYPDIQGHFSATLVRDTTLYPTQWHLAKIGAPTFWNITKGEGVTIALLDSGVDPDHPDLSENILFNQGYNFGDNNNNPRDQNGHGTAMAGLIVANCRNPQGACGVAPSAKIIPYKINQADSGQFNASDLAAAILKAADSSAKIISLSLVLNEFSPVVQDALMYAKSRGKVIVAATGNDGGQVAFPAYLSWVIGVGAVDKTGQRLRSSNYGNGLLISAPGIDLLTTQPGTGYANYFNGTSPATALVSGVLALLAASQPTATVPELTITLLSASQAVSDYGFDNQQGFGQVQMPLSRENNTADPRLEFSSTSTITYHLGDTLQLDLALTQVANHTADLYLRLNFPTNTQGERYTLFKVWNSTDNIEPIAYNQPLVSPFLLATDLLLPLYGTSTALLGRGKFDTVLPEGIYELSALLKLENNSKLRSRKLIWIFGS